MESLLKVIEWYGEEDCITVSEIHGKPRLKINLRVTMTNYLDIARTILTKGGTTTTADHL